MNNATCFHCGLGFKPADEIIFDDKFFCCYGCKMVYQIFQENGLTNYYEFAVSPGATPLANNSKFDFLDNPKIAEKLLTFSESNSQIISLQIPHIHCSACIWILENLRKLHPGISFSEVNFYEKKVKISFDTEKITLKKLVLLLCQIGYEPYISLEQYETKKNKVDKSLTYKLGVAFFCFGNIMLLSFPEYFELKEYWLDHYRNFFRILIFLLALPSFFYSASDYYVVAYKSIKNKIFNIDIPIALGIIVMFVRSVVDIAFNFGPGFFDSLTGLIFFMLLGKSFQIKTYKSLNFERDYKSYFPIAVTKIGIDNQEENIPIYDIIVGDKLLIRNQELIPSDGILTSAFAAIDYSFVTGESMAVNKVFGDKIFAGGRLQGSIIEIKVTKQTNQSYLTQLWSTDVFKKKSNRIFQSITDKISQYFTPALLFIAFSGFFYWMFYDTNQAFNVFTAVLIVACPCALALTAPFTLGNVLRLLGRQKIYLKNAAVIEQLAQVDTLVFDKTGTITSGKVSGIIYKGIQLSENQLGLIKNTVRASNHPLSRMLYDFLTTVPIQDILNFKEITGKGIASNIANNNIKIGSASYVGIEQVSEEIETTVYVKINDEVLGFYTFKNEYREGIKELFTSLGKKYTLIILSGDNNGEKLVLQEMLPKNSELIFNQKPRQKLNFIKKLQDQGKKVLMIGDGLNDAGALAQANVGIAISENSTVFSPACDAILDASVLNQLESYLQLSKKAIQIIRVSFALSITYNIVGLYLALSGILSPLFAAIIMPLSTITIILFVTIATTIYAKKLLAIVKLPKYDNYHSLPLKKTVILTHQT